MWAVQNTPTIFGGSFKQTKEKAESATRFDRTWRENIIITCHVRLLTRHQWLIQRTCWTLRFLHSKKGFSWPSKYTLHIVQFSLLARTFHPPTCIRKSIHSLSRSRNVSIFHRIFPWARGSSVLALCCLLNKHDRQKYHTLWISSNRRNKFTETTRSNGTRSNDRSDYAEDRSTEIISYSCRWAQEDNRAKETNIVTRLVSK